LSHPLASWLYCKVIDVRNLRCQRFSSFILLYCYRPKFYFLFRETRTYRRPVVSAQTTKDEGTDCVVSFTCTWQDFFRCQSWRWINQPVSQSVTI